MERIGLGQEVKCFSPRNKLLLKNIMLTIENEAEEECFNDIKKKYKV